MRFSSQINLIIFKVTTKDLANHLFQTQRSNFLKDWKALLILTCRNSPKKGVTLWTSRYRNWMNLNIMQNFKKTFDTSQKVLGNPNETYSESKRGCLPFLEVISFFLIFLLVLGFTTFCQRKEENYSNLISTQKLLKESSM